MSADVRELHESARQVLEGLGLAAAEPNAWTTIAELGWLMIATPEELGGLGMGLAGACALHMELGRGLATVPFIPAMVAIDALCQSALPDREERLSRLITGEDYVAAPLADAAFSFDHNANGETRITGTAVAVQSADRASHLLVSAGDLIALVPLAQPGVDIVPRPTWDETRRLFDVNMTDVVIDPHGTLALGDTAKALVRRLGTLRDFALAAEAIGGAAALLELTVDYLTTRQQFGRPLALFQALKHRCADLKALVEGAEALLLDSLARAGEQFDTVEAELAGKAAKQLSCKAYATVAEEALQLHGGIGMTSEHACHLFLKRAMLNEHLGRGQQTYEADLAARILGSSS